MTTELDDKIRTALHDAAATTTVSDDALASIMRRAAQRSGSSPRRRHRAMVAGGAIISLAAGAGATYATLTDRLDPEQAELVDDSACGINSSNAKLVASNTGLGRAIEYWTVDGIDSHADLLFDRGAAFGGGGCGPGSRAAVHPELPWVNYTLTADPRDGTGLGHFAFFGQAPAGTATVDIVTTVGTTHLDVTSPDGYFVTLADLPLPKKAPSAASPPDVDMFQRVDAYATDGTLLGTGGLS